MRTTIVLVTMLLLLPMAAADIKISVVSYDDDTKEAKILVANTGIDEYHDLTITFDETKPREYPGSLFKPGTAFIIPKVASEGFHMLTIKTGDGHVFRQELMFSPSGIERIKAAYPVRVSEHKVEAREYEPEQPMASRWPVWLLGGLALTFMVFAIVWLYPKTVAWVRDRRARSKVAARKPAPRAVSRQYQQQRRYQPARRPARPYRRPVRRRK
jgi:hypothetical protein